MDGIVHPSLDFGEDWGRGVSDPQSPTDLAEAQRGADMLFPEDDWLEIRGGDLAELADRVAFADDLHAFADRTGNPWFNVMAEVVCSPTLRCVWQWEAAYAEWQNSDPPPSEVVESLRAATKAMMALQPRGGLELCLWLRTVAQVGFHARLNRDHAKAGADHTATLKRLKRHLARLPNWVIGGSVDHGLRPYWINDLDMAPNGDEALVLKAVDDAGPSWSRAVGTFRQ